jgi:hypothetical protein
VLKDANMFQSLVMMVTHVPMTIVIRQKVVSLLQNAVVMAINVLLIAVTQILVV